MTTATKQGHTAGKWCIQREFDNEPIYIVAPHSGETIATVERHPDGDPSCDMPNARLLMSAPELLEALNVIARASERSEKLFGGSMSEVTRVFENITRVARAAIARATGQGGAK